MKKSLWVCVLIVAMVIGLSFNAAAEDGITDTEIHIGQWGPQTGPAAPWGSVARGTGAYFKMINAEGGIHGRKLVYHMFDDGYNPAKTKAGVKELQEGTGIFAWAVGVGTSPGLAVKDYLMARKTPWVGPAAGSLHWIEPPQKYLFGVYPLYYTEAQLLVRYAVKDLGLKKLAIVYTNDAYGKNGVMGAKKELIRHGLQTVAEIPVKMGTADLKPHVMKLRKSGADMVLLWTGPVESAKTVGISKAMKFTPQFLAASSLSDFPLMMAITKGLWEGVITGSFAELPDSTMPLMQKYKKDVHGQFAAPKERWGVFYYAGILFSEPMIEGLKRAGRNLTREKFVSAMESIKGFRGIGGEVNYAKFNPKDGYGTRQGCKQVFLIKCLAGGKAEKLTDWTEVKYDR